MSINLSALENVNGWIFGDPVFTTAIDNLFKQKKKEERNIVGIFCGKRHFIMNHNTQKLTIFFTSQAQVLNPHQILDALPFARFIVTALPDVVFERVQLSDWQVNLIDCDCYF